MKIAAKTDNSNDLDLVLRMITLRHRPKRKHLEHFLSSSLILSCFSHSGEYKQQHSPSVWDAYISWGGGGEYPPGSHLVDVDAGEGSARPISRRAREIRSFADRGPTGGCSDQDPGLVPKKILVVPVSQYIVPSPGDPVAAREGRVGMISKKPYGCST